MICGTHNRSTRRKGNFKHLLDAFLERLTSFRHDKLFAIPCVDVMITFDLIHARRLASDRVVYSSLSANTFISSAQDLCFFVGRHPTSGRHQQRDRLVIPKSLEPFIRRGNPLGKLASDLPYAFWNSLLPVAFFFQNSSPVLCGRYFAIPSSIFALIFWSSPAFLIS